MTIVEINPKLRERFCKDRNIPIKIFIEPYFSERLELVDRMIPGTIDSYNRFLKELSIYRNPQDYLEEYNHVKDSAINFIKGTDAYQTFNSQDMNVFAKDIKSNLPGKDIFKPSFVGRFFISIDMRKANFSSLHHYNPEIFGNAESWEEFISRFTSSQHIIESKYIRQVILGNCNPKRHITYEKYLMSKVLDLMVAKKPETYRDLVFFSNDEIVLDITDEEDRYNYVVSVNYIVQSADVPLKVEYFRLGKINGTEGYFKEFLDDSIPGTEFKCLDSIMYPITVKKFFKAPVFDNDLVFIHEGRLAKFLESPDISFAFHLGDM